MMQAYVIVLTVGTLMGVGGYPHGAPSSACEDMIPHHDQAIPRDDVPPYYVEVSPTTYRQGDVLSVTMSSRSGEKFVGFLLEARLIDKDGNIGDYVGAFSPAEHTKLISKCGNGVSALTHVDAHKWSFYNLTLKWTPRTSSKSDVIIRATFVQSFLTFWVDIRSHVIKDLSTPQPLPILNSTESTEPSPVTRTTDDSHSHDDNDKQSKSGNLVMDSDCGRTRGCLVNLECGRTKGCYVDCDSYGCDYVVSWMDRGDAVEFEIAAQTHGHGDQWVAIGFSKDIEMGDDGVVECDSQSGIVSVSQAYNYKYYTEIRPQPHIGLNNTGGSLSDGIFWCKFARLKSISGDDVLAVFDLNKPWVIMLATGEMRQGEMQMHILSPKYGPWTSSEPVDFSRFSVAGRGRGSFTLIKIHGCLMILAWIICASIGILVARYYRSEWSSWRPGGKKMWFLIHRACMVVTFLSVVVSFFVIFEESSRGFGPIANGRRTHKLFESVHPPLGLTVFLLAVINPIVALFRPEPDHQYRIFFNWFHRGVGCLAFILAGFTVYFGLGMEKAAVPKFGLDIMLGYALYQTVVFISLEIWHCLDNRLMRDEKTEGSQAEYSSLIKNDQQGESVEDFEDTVWTWKAVFFIGNAAILTVVGILLMVLVTRDFS